MTDGRIDRLLGELTRRYELTDEFQRQLRPVVATILSDEISEDDRLTLLEELAATCQRDQQMRNSSEVLRGSTQSIRDSVQELVVLLLRARGTKR